jgi:hypothetical protein
MSGSTMLWEVNAEADPSAVNGFDAPYGEDLVGYYEMDPALVSNGALVNLVNPALPALIVGDPLMEADGFTFEGLTSFLDTQIHEAAAFTVGAIAKPVVAGGAALPKAVIAGNFTNPGSMLFYEAPAGGQTIGSIRAVGFVNNGAGGATSAPVSINEPTGALAWSSAWGRIGATSRSVANLTTGQETTLAEARARVLDNARTLRIGSSYAAGYTGKIKIARCAIYQRYVTDPNRLLMHEFWKADVAGIGIIP